MMSRHIGLGYVRLSLPLLDDNGVVVDVLEEEFKNVKMLVDDRRNPVIGDNGIPHTDGCVEIRIIGGGNGECQKKSSDG